MGNEIWIPLQLKRLQSADEGKRTSRPEYGVTYIRAGKVRRRDGGDSGWTILPEALENNVEMFSGLGMQIDHPSLANFMYPSLRDTVAVTFSPQWNSGNHSVDGGARLYRRDDLAWFRQLLDEILADQEAGLEVPDVGLSAVVYTEDEEREEELVTFGLRKAESVDFVFGPGAEGRLREALSVLGKSIFTFERPSERSANYVDDRERSLVQSEHSREQLLSVQGGQTMDEQLNSGSEATVQGAPPIEQPEPEPVAEQPSEQSGMERVLSMLEAQQQQIERLTGALAQCEDGGVVEGMGQAPRSNIQVGYTGLDRVQLALDAMLDGVLPPAGVLPLSGIRELYNLLSGDYEMTGVFQGDRVYLANVNSTTMAGMVANALNKRIVTLFTTYPRWWEPGGRSVLTEMDFQSLQDVRWVNLGGVGELPTVAEGAAYTELTWDDQTETKAFVKKGGYLGITQESIDKDDTGKLRAAPAALARAAWMTLGKLISAVFTDNSGTGPAMSDSNYLFDATNHSNLSTSYTVSPANVRNVKLAMMKQTEINSGERLGALTKPYFYWVPVDLEDYMVEILGSANKADTANNNVNVDAEGEAREARLARARQRIVACPFWTDTNNWAAQADPDLYPSLGVGYRYGRVPEVFTVSSPLAGLMFTNDTMPVKVRFYVAVGPTDWRGLYKCNV